MGCNKLVVNRNINLYQWIDLKEISETEKKIIPCLREKHSSCVYGDYIYILGGVYKNAYLKDFWRYHIYHNEWEKLDYFGSLPGILMGHSMVPYEGQIYIFGGEFNQDITETPLWIYDIDLNRVQKWKYSGDGVHPTGRRGHTAVKVNNSMLIFGGFLEIGHATAELWAFDLETQNWENVKSHGPSGRYGHTAVMYNDNMWVLGGTTDLSVNSDMWRWHILRKEWVHVRSSGCPSLTGHSAAIVGDCMFVFGGMAGNYVMRNSLYRYYFATGVWEKMYTNSGSVSPRMNHSLAPVIPSLSSNIKDQIRSQSCSNIKTKFNHISNSPSHPSSMLFHNKVYPEFALTNDVCNDGDFVTSLSCNNRSVNSSHLRQDSSLLFYPRPKQSKSLEMVHRGRGWHKGEMSDSHDDSSINFTPVNNIKLLANGKNDSDNSTPPRQQETTFAVQNGENLVLQKSSLSSKQHYLATIYCKLFLIGGRDNSAEASNNLSLWKFSIPCLLK